VNQDAVEQDSRSPERRVTRDLMIINKKGLHARATAKFVQCCEAYESVITITKDDETVGGNSIMAILTLGAAKGATLRITATGRDAEEALDALEALVASRFGEGE
jgi:phosphocarrier protein HPr